MSILETESAGAPQPVAPYRRGDRISVVSPEGIRFVAKVETVTPQATGEFAILAAIREPRRYRSHLLTTTVDARGTGSHLDTTI